MASAAVIDKTHSLHYRISVEERIEEILCTQKVYTYKENLCGTNIVLQRAGHVAFSTATYYSPVPVYTCEGRSISVYHGVSRATKRQSDQVLFVRAAKKLKLGTGCLHQHSTPSLTAVDVTSGLPLDTYYSIEGLKESTENTDQYLTLHRLVDRIEYLEAYTLENLYKGTNSTNIKYIKEIVSSKVEPVGFTRFEKWAYIAEYMEQNPEDTVYQEQIYRHLLNNPVPTALYNTFQYNRTSCTATLGKPRRTWGYL
jgi:hypothetical protein